MVNRDTIMQDVLLFIKKDLNNNLTDPLSSTRTPKSQFVMTSYPANPVNYPIVTLKIINKESLRVGMQSSLQDITLTLEVRIWARNEKEKETIYQEASLRLAEIQFTDTTGSIANNIHDYNELSATEIAEEGQPGAKVIKSRIMQIQYKFYDI